MTANESDMCPGTEVELCPFDTTTFTSISSTDSHSYASLGSHFSDGAAQNPLCNTTPVYNLHSVFKKGTQLHVFFYSHFPGCICTANE